MLPRVQIVLPCYNPPAGWQLNISVFYDFISPYYNVSFLVVDDGTVNDDVSAAVSGIAAPVRLITLPKNSGKGFALRAGVAEAEAPTVMYTDVDLPFTHESMKRVLDAVSSGRCDIAAGSRDVSYYQGAMTAFRRRLSRAFRFFMRRVLRIRIHDPQCGLKAFNQKGRVIFLKTRTNRYLFDFEFVYIALHDPSVRIEPVNADIRPDVVFSRMKVPVLLREVRNLLWILLRRRA